MKMECENCIFAVRDNDEVVECTGDCEFARLMELAETCSVNCEQCPYVIMEEFGDEWIPTGCMKEEEDE